MGGKGQKFLKESSLKAHLEGITKPAIRRLARRGGVARLGDDIYEETREATLDYLRSVLKDAIAYTDCANRKTVTAKDVAFALKRRGETMYGFD